MSHVRRLPDSSIYLDIIHVFGAWGIKNGSLLLCESEEVHVYMCYHSKQHPQVNASGPERDILVFFWGGGAQSPPSKHKTFVWHLYNIGPTSKTLDRHCTNVIQMFCVCWALSTSYRLGSCQWQCYNIQTMIHWPNAGLILVKRLRRWPNI